MELLRASAALILLAGIAVPIGVGSIGEIVPGPVPAEVLAVLDGDTLVVRARIWLGQDVETRIRLDGIDAPELKGKCESERRKRRPPSSTPIAPPAAASSCATSSTGNTPVASSPASRPLMAAIFPTRS